MIYIREVRMLANDAEAKLERMREEKLPCVANGRPSLGMPSITLTSFFLRSETEWEKSEGQAPVVRSRMGWFGSASD